MGGSTYRVGQTLTSTPKWLMWTWCNSLQISSFKCLIYPSSRSWEFLLQFSAFAPSSCSSLTRISPFGTAVFRVLAKLCYKQLFVGIYNMYKKKKNPSLKLDTWRTTNTNQLSVRSQAVVLQRTATCMHKYLHTRLLHTLNTDLHIHLHIGVWSEWVRAEWFYARRYAY